MDVSPGENRTVHDPNTGVEVEVKVICNTGPGNIEGKSQNLND